MGSEYEDFTKEIEKLINYLITHPTETKQVDFRTIIAELGITHKVVSDQFYYDIVDFIRSEEKKEKEKQTSVTNQLKPLQRVAHISPTFESLSPLLSGGLISALEISQIPEDQFADNDSLSKPDQEKSKTRKYVAEIFKKWWNWRKMTFEKKCS